MLGADFGWSPAVPCANLRKRERSRPSSARGALRALIDRQRERILNDLTGMGAHRRTDVVKFHNYLPLSFDGIGPESDVLFGGRKV